MIIIFPGQGSQQIGMGKDIYDNFSEAREVFNEVDDSINFQLSKLIFEGTEEDLKLTKNTQPALMAVSIAFLRVLEKEFGFSITKQAKYLAGHSLGEYTALCASGVLSLRDTAKILRVRGEAMASAYPKGGAMAAILGVDIDIIDKIVNQISNDKFLVQIANDNSIGQVVISGHQEAVKSAMNKAIEVKARNAILLQVSGPFHSKLMQPAIEKLEEVLNGANFNNASVPIIANISAKAETQGFRCLLIKQLTGRVRWRESILFAEQHGITKCVEVGAGKVLTGLVKRTSPNIKLYNINSLESLSKIKELC